MRVLVTGSSGLIGRWVGKRLDAEGVEWAGLDKEPKKADQGSAIHFHTDLRDGRAVKRAFQTFRPSALIHLAARCDLEGRRIEDYEVNHGAVELLCDVVRRTPSLERCIFTSSQLVCRVGYLPRHDTDYCPDTIYGESKVATERIIRRHGGGRGTWCIARPTTVWGPHMNTHYQSLLRHIQNGRYFHAGSGALMKSYAYAENIAYQYFRLLEAAPGDVHQRAFYLADYEPPSLRAFVNKLADEMNVRRPITVPLALARMLAWSGDILGLTGARVPYNSFRLRNIRTEYVFDLSKTRGVCGELPKSFEEGVRDTVNWYLGLKA